MATAAQFASKPYAGVPATVTAANTAIDGTGATGRALIATAETVTGGGTMVPLVRLAPLGTNVKTVLRFFRNNGSDPEVAGNNAFIGEVALAASTISNTDPSLFAVDFDFRAVFGEPGLMLTGHATTPERLYVTLATAVAAGIKITPINAAHLT